MLEVLLPDTGRNLTPYVKGYRLETDYTVATDGFSLELYSETPSDLDDLLLQQVELVVEGASQLIGRVEVVEASGQGTALRVMGRDYLADLIETHIDPSFTVAKGETLGSALARACAPAGIADVVDDADVGMRDVRSNWGSQGAAPPSGMKAREAGDLKAEPGMGLFDWANRVAARVGGATLQPGRSRTQLVLSKPHYEQSTRYAIHRRRDNPGATANNVRTSAARQDLSSFPTHVVATGKVGTGGRRKETETVSLDTGWAGPDSIAGRLFRGRYSPDDGPRGGTQVYRLHYLRDDESRSELELSNLAARRMSEHLRHSLEYTVQLQGFTDPETSAVWAVDTMVDVDDDVRGVREPLWVASRSFTYQQGQGAITELKCWRPWSYVI
ncbi:MAG: hypothetical protein AAF715_31595 [Myxococcota bacterium]